MNLANTESMFGRLMPAEWETHQATWIAWPHHEPDWPGKLEAINWIFAEIVRLLVEHERVEILCHDESVLLQAKECLSSQGLGGKDYRLHIVPNNRCWLRDAAPTAVRASRGSIELIDWRFNAWAKYDNYQYDDEIPKAVERITSLKRIEAHRPDGNGRAVLEGGAIDTDGAGTLIATEECLLSAVQIRNPGLDRQGYERLFAEHLGIRKTIWLAAGCEGDDTHGHIDDVARFVGPHMVVCVYEPDPAKPGHEQTRGNFRRLVEATDAQGRSLRVVPLPMPKPIIFEGERLPASYANFYIANDIVLVPTFNDPNDRLALAVLADLFSDREIVGVHCVDLVWGMGTIHCLTQQQPMATQTP